MNESVKHKVSELRTALDRLETALDQQELHPAAITPVRTHMREMIVWINNLATGLMQQADMPEWFRDNPPPMRSPDIRPPETDD